jgi:hypothetical protein
MPLLIKYQKIPVLNAGARPAVRYVESPHLVAVLLIPVKPLRAIPQGASEAASSVQRRTAYRSNYMSQKTAKTTKAAKATKGSAKPASKAPSQGRDQQNGVNRPGDGTLCAKVWEALDRLTKTGKDITFEAVRELAGKEMADATIRTQRQRHREFHGINREAKKPALKGKTIAKDAAPALVSGEVQPQG